MREKLNILIVEDDAIITQLIELYLTTAGHTIAGIAHDSETAMRMFQRLKPAMVLLDINILGDKDGIAVGEYINEIFPVPIIFITALSDVKTINRAKKIRPSGYIIKPFREEELYSAITIGYYNFGQRSVTKKVTKEQIDQFVLSPLSKREFELLLDITEGYTNEQIASKQYLSLNTVKWHIQNIYSKLGVKNRTSAAQLILRL